MEEEAHHVTTYTFAERVKAIDALFMFTTSSVEEECQRRTRVINTLIALCEKQETQGFRRRKFNTKVDIQQPTAYGQRSLSETLPIICEATQCIFCLGNEALPISDRVKTFAARGDLKKHFHRKHLRHHRKNDPIACPHPRCKTSLEGVMDLQNHAARVHKSFT